MHDELPTLELQDRAWSRVVAHKSANVKELKHSLTQQSS